MPGDGTPASCRSRSDSGRCSHCRQPISLRYPRVEALTALIAALLAWRFGPTPAFAALLALAFALPAALLRGSELRGLRVPFGPFLCLGAFMSLMWGESLLFWWLCFLQG